MFCNVVQSSLRHRTVENTENPTKASTPYTRTYVNHLLHTHEMAAHALLAMQNITERMHARGKAVLEQEPLCLNNTRSHVNEVKADQTWLMGTTPRHS
jgi:queuine/archaeosine tRNA-ribosyltransferase